MPLDLIVGRANTGKTGAAYHIIRTALKDGRSPVLVVPSLPDVERARGEFAGEASLGLAIVTFDELVGGLWAEHGDGRKILAPATNSLLLMRSLRESGLGMGFERTAAPMVTALTEQTGVAWRGRRPSSAYPMESALLHFAGELEHRALITAAEAAWLVATRLVPTDNPVVIHRFDDFTPSQIHLTKALARVAPVCVSLTWEEDFAPTAALDGLVRALEPDTVMTTRAEPYNTQPELVELADGLFGEVHSLARTGAVVLGIAGGEEAQSTLVLDAVEKELDRGVEPGRIAVALRSAEAHATSLKRAFEDAGIAAAFDVVQVFGKTSFGSAAMDALSAALGDAEALMAVIRTPYSGLDPEAARELEARVRKAGASTSTYRALFGDGPLEDVRRAVSGLQNGSGRWWQLAEALSALYAAASRTRGSDDGLAALDAKAFRAAVTVLESAQEVGEGVALADVLAVLEAQTVHAGGLRSDWVQVLPVTRLRGRRFDVVIIAGLNAGEFPAVPDESGLPGSRVHAILHDLGGVGIAGNGPDFEELLFYETLTRASQRVVLIGKSADEEGEALQLSPLWEMVADRYAPAREGVEEIPGLVQREVAQPPAGDARGRERLLAQARSGAADTPRVVAAARRMAGRPGAVTDPAGVAPAVLSASQIETYLSCPYRWFYDHAVGATDLEREFDAAEEGRVAHDYLRVTYERLLAGGHTRVHSGNLPQALQLLDEVAAERESVHEMGLAERVGIRMAKRWAARILTRDADDTSAFAPWRFEWSFGYEEAVDLGGFALRGRIDRIDVDGSGHAVITDYKRSAKDGLNGAALLEKRAVQVLLYMEAMARVTGLEPIAGVYRGMKQDKITGVVQSDTGAAPLLTNRNASVNAEELAVLRQEALALARMAAEGMRAGRIDPDPHDANACTFCGARAVCGEAL